MTLEDLGNIGEFVGAIGVVASLIYLALQTRQNTRAVRVASFHQISESVSALSLAVFQDADLVSLMERVRSEPETLSSEDTTRYGFSCSRSSVAQRVCFTTASWAPSSENRGLVFTQLLKTQSGML